MRYDVPSELQPLSPWKYFWLNILYAIPVIGFIFLVIHAIGAGNVNKRNYARSFFCVLVLALIIAGVILLAGGGIAGLKALLEKLS